MKNSSFYLTARYPPPGYMLLGDGGYPCLQTPVCLLTPYKEPVIGRVQQRFNYRQSKARSVIERAFGMMKTRWRSTLGVGLHHLLKKQCKSVVRSHSL